MGKLVILKIIDGDFEHGFTVMLQVGEEGARPSIEITGKLPPFPEMPLYFSRWQTNYEQLDSCYRITAKKEQKTNVSVLQDCKTTASILKAQLDEWLLAEEFRKIREKLLGCLSPTDSIRMIIQTQDNQLRQLPWNLIDLLESYPKAEVALSALDTEAPPIVRSQSKAQVHLLSILGNSDGINVKADQALLEALPKVNLKTLVEPERKELTDYLWSHSWDVLFFAGHSSSYGSKETGKIFLNKTDSLSIGELKYALRRAVENGLQLAIFNSCDGLGLARELADLRIPQIIVMREPVPDIVAQEFLKYFLAEYSKGTPLYLAVREAREHLQALENRFPCATWLPVICQHPAVLPPTWHDFTASELPPLASQPSTKRKIAIALLTSLVMTIFVSGIRLAGVLQGFETRTFDHTLRLRSEELPDPRLLVVAIDDEDLRLQRQQESLSAVSISNANLEKLLTLLMEYQPRAIGLDLYRDEKTPPQYANLAAQFKQNEKLIGICKVGYDEANPYGIQAPPEIPPQSYRVGFSDFLVDSDEVIRRHLLAFNTANILQSRCRSPIAFSVELAFLYFKGFLDGNESGFSPKWNEHLKFQMAKPPTDLPTIAHGYALAAKPAQTERPEVSFPTLQYPLAGYSKPSDAFGQQTLLNYRATRRPVDVATFKPLRWFLSKDSPPTAQELQNLIHGKVVLIGVTAREKDDFFKTPYGYQWDERVPGVFLHAHMLSQILSHTLDGRPLLWTWPLWVEMIWIGGWAIVGSVLTGWIYERNSSQRARRWQLPLAVGLSSSVLYGSSVGILVLSGGWVPLVPSLLAFLLTSTGVILLLYQQPTQSLEPAYSR